MNSGETPGGQPVAKPGENGEVRADASKAHKTAAQRQRGHENAKVQLTKAAGVLRSHPPRGRSGDNARLRLARHLTDRDRALLRAISRHRVLTTPQVARLYFTSHKRAAARLLALYDLGVLDRFVPHRNAWGSHPWHWVVGRLGAAVLAAEADGDPDTASRRWKGGRALAYASGQRLAHLTGLNECFVELATATTGTLIQWLTEAECAEWTEGIVRPDAWGLWRAGADRNEPPLEFFLEFDRGTETHERLAGKLPAYERFESERGRTAWVLFMFPTDRRERSVRAALADATVPVATASVATGTAADAVWAPLRAGERRLRLHELAAVPIPPEARARAAACGARAWRFELPRDADPLAPDAD